MAHNKSTLRMQPEQGRKLTTMLMSAFAPHTSVDQRLTTASGRPVKAPRNDPKREI